MRQPQRFAFVAVMLLLAGLLGLVWRSGILADSYPKFRVIDHRANAAIAQRELRGSQTAAVSRALLADLKRALRQMETREASAWILQQLQQGENFPTHLQFTIASGNVLEGWPTYRVFLLDLLMQVDPNAAVVKARGILQKMDSPDEWAVCLRNLARDSTDATDTLLLKQKSAELLRHSDWRHTPSAGYLHAFDIIVHTANTELVPDLVNLCDDRDQKAVRHAAFLTLDKLTINKPTLLLPLLAKHASQHQRSGLMISNMIARGDLRDETQRQAIESYLLDDKRTAEELRGFASVFPNANMAVSNNLLTPSLLINGAEQAAKDRAALDIVAFWLRNPAFARSHAVLHETYRRLRGFVE